jgi:hypothetical protein
MTEEQYFAVLRRKNYRPSGRPNVYFDSEDIPRYVPHPAKYSPEEREEILTRAGLWSAEKDMH